MPRFSTSVCTTPGCGCITPGGRCPDCTRIAIQSRTTGAAVYDARWERTRRAYLKAHPVCQCDACLQLPHTMRPWATEVHHIDGLGPRGVRGHDWSNLCAMTHAHHAKITAREQPGGWNDRE